MDKDAPALHPELVDIDSLTLDPKNARLHSTRNLDVIGHSLGKFQQVKAIVVSRRTRKVIAGNGTLTKAISMGAEKIVVVWVSKVVDPDTGELREMTEAEASELGLLDNRSAELAEWDTSRLAETIGESPTLDWSAGGWTAGDFESFDVEWPLTEVSTVSEHDREGAGDGEATTPVEPPIPDPPAEPVTKLGEVIQIGPHTLHCADCMDVMAGLADNSVDAIVTDPPYGLSPDGVARTWDDIEALRAEGKGPTKGFMGRSWDAGVPGITWARECLRVLKPGGHIVAFSATRTVHRLACAIEDAGFQIRDQLGWLTWQGFPKSLDVSKAIDRQKYDREQVLEVTKWIRETRDAAGLKNSDIDGAFGFAGMSGHWTSKTSQPSVPTLEQVPVLLALLGVTDPPPRIRELLLDLNAAKGEPGPNWWKREVTGHHADSAPAQTWQANYVEGFVANGAKEQRDAPATEDAKKWAGWGTALKPAIEPAVIARKPLSEGTVALNVLKWGTGAINIDAGRHADGDKAWPGPYNKSGWTESRPDADGEFLGLKKPDVHHDHDLGKWPANIYHCPKPATRERNEGTDDLPSETCGTGAMRDSGRGKTATNTHPTVKPRGLFSQLLRLFCPPGGVVLEPFGGSGTTPVSAAGLDCSVIIAEREPGYADIIRARVAWSLDPKSATPTRRTPARDGDKRQARRRVQTLQDNGTLPRPEDVTCVDCKAKPGREYDHHLGYGADHHEDVEALCAGCHHKREAQREAQREAAAGSPSAS